MNAGLENGEIVEFVRAYVALSKGKRFEAKRGLWDSAEPRPLLSPEEASSPMIGWAAIEGYWSHSNEVMKDLETECWDIGVTWLASDMAIATYFQRWRARLKDASSLLTGPIASTVRVVLGLRRRGSEWRVFLCVESHVDGIEYFRSMFERRA